RENLSAQLYGSLRSALMDGQYAPGERLTIASIAGDYGTSITPVREAIFRLVTERALEMRASTSIRVPVLNPARLREIQKIRRELEGLAAYTVAGRITETELLELNSIQVDFMRSVTKDP